MKSVWIEWIFKKYMCNCVYVYNIFQALGEAVTEKKLLTGRPSGSKLVNFQTKGTGTSTSSSSSSVMSWRFQQQSNGWKSSDFQDPSNFKDYRNMFNDEKTLVKLKRSRESWTFWWLLFLSFAAKGRALLTSWVISWSSGLPWFTLSQLGYFPFFAWSSLRDPKISWLMKASPHNMGAIINNHQDPSTLNSPPFFHSTLMAGAWINKGSIPSWYGALDSSKANWKLLGRSRSLQGLKL